MTLVLEDLKKHYKEVKALDGLSFRLEAGQSLALLGPNGAGKSTAIRMMVSLLTPDSGRFEYEGVDLFAQPHRLRCLVGYVSQEMAMDKILTGLEFMRFHAGLHHLDWKQHRSKAENLLDTLGLSEAAHRRVGTYSGGMKRRLDLACALLSDPEVLILDEPTTGLDIEARESIWEMVRQFLKDGGRLILASHDFHEVGELAGHVIVLHQGQMVRDGSPEDLKAQLGDFVVRVKTREFMSPSDVSAVRDCIAGHKLDTTFRPSEEWAVFAVKSQASMQALQEQIYAAVADLNPIALDVSKPGIEDVYRFAVGGTS